VGGLTRNDASEKELAALRHEIAALRESIERRK